MVKALLFFENMSFVFAGVAQLVEHHPSKLAVAGSSPVTRSSRYESLRAMRIEAFVWAKC